MEEIVTDNGTAYVAALDWLASRYGICHIHISAYNSQANSIVERQHWTIHDSLVKACDGDASKWPTAAPFVFWANCTTTHKSTGLSPFFMAHGVKPILPFDITLATFLVPDLTKPLSTDELIAICVRQLKKHQDDLTVIHDRILKSRYTSVHQFKWQYENTIQHLAFKPGDLVLVCNSGSDTEVSNKMKPQYFGPMVVIHRTHNGTYCLAELDSTVLKLCYAAF